MGEVWIVQLHKAAILIAAAILGISLLLFTFLEKRTEKKQSKVFIGMVFLLLFNCLTSITKEFALPFYKTSTVAWWLVRVMQFLYFATHTTLGWLFLNYVQISNGVGTTNDKAQNDKKKLYFIPIAFALLMVLLNPLNHFVYRTNELGQVVRGSGEMLIYIISAGYFVLSLVILVRNWKSISESNRWTMLFFLATVVVGVGIQLVNIQIRSELFSEMLGMMSLMILVETEDERIDPTTAVYNRAALIKDLKTKLRILEHFNAICVRITNADILQRLLGTADNEVLLQLVSKYLIGVHTRQYIYRTTPDSFILIHDGGNEQAEALADEIYERFEHPFDFQGSEILLQSVVMCAAIPEVFEHFEDVLLLCDGPLPARDKEHMLKGGELDYLVRRAEVVSALHRGLSEHRFEVYYQPVYRMKGMTIYSAEALLRLKDGKIGNITPDEFIPIAEQNGMIDRLGDYVIEEVCLFLSSGIPVEMGLDCIEINLSVLQCLQPGFVNRVKQIVQKYDVSPAYINFEVTESAAANDYGALDQVLDDLKAAGFLLSLDDYGIGYSNVRSVFSLDFDLIKIDKSILWEVNNKDEEDQRKGRVILENSIRMIREMNLKILVEGVETQEQVELLEQLEVDYLQGFYFSRPVSKNELLGILRVTEIARMEEQRARAASDAKSNFLANMSHEIRTPINAILGMNEMILRESHNEHILEYAQNIEGAGRTLVSLINDILDFSKIESGSMEIVEAEYDLSSVVNDVVNMIQVKAKEKGLQFNIKVNPDMPDALWGDGMRVRQIIVNILNNAVKYTPKGSVTLDINGNIMGKDMLELVITVTDTGIGIKDEDIGKLFGKFQRLDENVNRNIEGSGLGLAITSNLLRLMHGEIDARSVYGEGSTFTVVLPQKIVRPESIGDFRRRYLENNRERESYRESFRAPEARILVVDDTAVNHTVIRELLKLTKVVLDSAMSGKECLEMARVQHYDLILLDFRMPEMDGIETLHFLKAIPDCINANTPVVALTANAVTGARERFLGEGFDEYMIKPVDGPKLEDLLIRMLPASKVQLVDAKEQLEEESADAEAEQAEWLSMLENLNIKEGIRNCGSLDGYRSVLKIYYEGLRSKAAEIEACYEKEDWENYTIQVHALKSSSRVIGADELSAMAAELEAAGNERNISKIQSNHAVLLTRYYAYEKILKAIFEEEKQEEGAAALPPIEAAMLQDAYETMKDFAKMYDYDSMLYVLDTLKEYSLPSEDKEKTEKIRQLTEDFKWEEISELLNQ